MLQKRGRNLKILLLDDEKDICVFFKAFLVKRGFKVKTALTARAAINLARKFKPQMAVLDIHLYKGKLNGMDVLKFLTENQPGCYCIMVTRDDNQQIISQSKEIGARDYLVKPLTLEKVEKSIQQAVLKVKKGAL